MARTQIDKLIMLGDSLSDRGTLDHRHLFHVLPMDRLAGLKGKSPQGRFTNGLVWSDQLSAMVANHLYINELKQRRHLSSEDISEAVLTEDSEIVKALQDNYSLDDDRRVCYQGTPLVRNYDEGGLTSHNYASRPSFAPDLVVARHVVATLDEKRQQLLADDEALHATNESKAHAMIIEWSGANDLITAFHTPNDGAVERAVKDRLKNVRELIKNGYRHFFLFNLPDISLTPRFQRLSKAEQANAKHCVEQLNQALAVGIAEIAKEYPQCSVELFDIHGIFNDIYHHPAHYHLEADKLKQPYTETEDFRLINEGGTSLSPASGYLFWDDVHPTADVHALLAEKFFEHVQAHYDFLVPNTVDPSAQEIAIPEEKLLEAFRSCYEKNLQAERNRFFVGHFRRSNIDYKKATLEDILKHGLLESGYRTAAVLKELQWLDDRGQLKLRTPCLRTAYEAVMRAQGESSLVA